jgi:hypothetical protein
VDGDDLPDLIIGNQFQFLHPDTIRTYGRLYLYKNIGTLSAPAFQLVDTNFLGFASPNVMRTRPNFLYPAAGDVDGDGDLDLIVSLNDGRCFYFENQRTSGNAANLKFITDNFAGLQNMGIAMPAPIFYDLNKDGHQDLIVGASTGALWYFRNDGSGTGSTAFNLQNSFLGEVRVTEPLLGAGSFGYASPLFVDVNHDGTDELLVGNARGGVFAYTLPANPEFAPFDSLGLVGRNFTFEGVRITRYPAMLPDSSYYLLAGMRSGGAVLHRIEFSTRTTGIDSTDTTQVLARGGFAQIPAWLFPNPTTSFSILEAPAGTQVTVLNMLGQTVLETMRVPADGRLRIEADRLAKGVYTLRLQNQQATRNLRWVVQQ